MCSGSFGPRSGSGGRVLACHARSPKFDPQKHINQLQWYLPVLLTLGWWRQEDQKFRVIPSHSQFKASLGYMKPCLKEIREPGRKFTRKTVLKEFSYVQLWL